MITEERDVADRIEDMFQYFYNYLFTKTVRDISLSAQMKDKHWDYIKSLESQKSVNYGRRTYSVEEIYMILIPFVEFLKSVNTEVLPNLNNIIFQHSTKLSLSPQEKSVRNMLLDNYEENIHRFGNSILDLYETAVAEDLKINRNKTPLCLSIKEIKQLEEDLSFIEDHRKLQR